MSYEIIYNAFSVKQGEAVIPYVISGSNNVYTMDYATGREAVDDKNLNFYDKNKSLICIPYSEVEAVMVSE